MMAKVGLISCVSLKQKTAAAASELYISPLFKKSKEYATDRLDKFFILSAKYGLLSPEDKIQPYNLTLKSMSRKQRMNWSSNVYKSLIEHISELDEVVFLAGESYREFLEEMIKLRGNKTACPLYRMSIGEQLQWYSNYSINTNILPDLDRFYSLLTKLKNGLNGGLLLKDATGKMRWPSKGVYFFFEDDEFRKTNAFEPRVVRVGTHAVSEGSSTSLWHRLRTHRGGLNLDGNHRGSIFRLHVGKSIIAKELLEYPTWGIGQTASKRTKEIERSLENRVSEFIGNMRILWLQVEDKAAARSDRSFIEINSIGLLSNVLHMLDTPSKLWLGNHNPHRLISTSGLWNVNYVDRDYDPRFLDILEKFVNVTIGNEAPVQHSIVPPDWVINRRKKNPQLDLFD